MVSLRRRKNLGLPLGNTIPVEIPVLPRPDPVQTVKMNEDSVPSAALNKPVENNGEMEITVDNPAAKQERAYVQVDPENPKIVHAYLMELKEKNRFSLGPMRGNDGMPVKEWMEEHFPHVFRVFPQDPKVIQFNDESKQHEFLFANYWLFLFEVRNLVNLDFHITPKCMNSLVNVIGNLEKLGFDCRFMRSELLYVATMMNKQLTAHMGEKTMIRTRMVYFDVQLENVLTDKEAVKEETKAVMEALPREGEQNNLQFTEIEKECFLVILQRHKMMLKETEGEIRRINKVLVEINKLFQGNAARAGR